jgi:hypothetical protein
MCRGEVDIIKDDRLKEIPRTQENINLDYIHY